LPVRNADHSAIRAKKFEKIKKSYEYIFNLIQLRVSPVGVIRRWPSGVWI